MEMELEPPSLRVLLQNWHTTALQDNSASTLYNLKALLAALENLHYRNVPMLRRCSRSRIQQILASCDFLEAEFNTFEDEVFRNTADISFPVRPEAEEQLPGVVVSAKRVKKGGSLAAVAPELKERRVTPAYQLVYHLPQYLWELDFKKIHTQTSQTDLIIKPLVREVRPLLPPTNQPPNTLPLSTQLKLLFCCTVEKCCWGCVRNEIY